jgi:hypothetical protein
MDTQVSLNVCRCFLIIQEERGKWKTNVDFLTVRIGNYVANTYTLPEVRKHIVYVLNTIWIRMYS